MSTNATYREMFCTRHWVGQGAFLLHVYKGLAVLYILLSILVTLGNILILTALHKITSLHAPSKLLFRNLTITDLCVGLFALPVTSVLVISTTTERWELCRFTKYSVYAIGTTLSGVSLATLSTISVDRLLALLLGLRYRQVMTLKRVRVVTVFAWIKSAAAGLLYILNMEAFLITSAVLIFLEVAISTYSYTRIFCIIRTKQAQVEANTHTGNRATVNLLTYKKTLYSTLWVHTTLAGCFLPFSVVTAINAIYGASRTLFLCECIAVLLIFMNSLLNPALYCWKIKEVRRVVKETIRQICPCLRG